MHMHNPTHPGEFILETYLKPYGISCRTLASHLDVAASTLNRVLKGQSGVSPEMALRLAKVVGRSPESWLTMQDHYNLWEAKKVMKLNNLRPLNFDAI